MLFNEPLKVIGEGRFLRLSKIGQWEFVERTNSRCAAAILAITEDHKALFIRQPRASVNALVVELPAGLVGDQGDKHPDETIDSAAKRELLEETGYEASHIRMVADGIPSAGLSSETVSLFLATGLRHVTDQLGDGAEQIELFKIPIHQVFAWLDEQRAQGVYIDLKIYAALLYCPAVKVVP